MNSVNGPMDLIDVVSTALGMTVLHSLWQFALVGVVATLILMVVKSAPARYCVWCGSLLVCMGLFVMTFVSAVRPGSSGAEHVLGELGMLSGMLSGMAMPMGAPDPAAQTIVFEVVAWLWAGGFVFFALRFVTQWMAAQRLRTVGVVEVDERWNTVFCELRDQLGVSARVGMVGSSIVHSPMVVGWLRPLVIVPMGMLTGLRSEYVQAVLVHELEHIRRHDHLVNAVQVLIETVLFYHPAVWWISHQARLEREHCCDDAAVKWVGDPAVFARALADLETTRTNSRAVLAMNQGGSLMNRITRILGTTNDTRPTSSAMRTMMAMTVGAIVAGAGIAHAASKVNDPTESAEKTQRLELEIEAMIPELEVEVLDAAIDLEGDPNLASLALIGVCEESMRSLYGTLTNAGNNSEIEKKVSAGELTRQEADAAYLSIRNERKNGMNARVQAYMGAFGRQILGQVESGEISQESGDALISEARKSVEMRLKWASMEFGILDAVDAGKMTHAEAQDALKAVRDERQDIVNQEWIAVRSRIESAVAEGTMTRGDAERAYERATERLFPQGQAIKVVEQVEVDRSNTDQSRQDQLDHPGIAPYVADPEMDC